MGYTHRPERAELAILESLNDEIDQLAAQARDCEEMAPALKDALDLAWYFSEAALRDAGKGSCGHGLATRSIDHCTTCAHFTELRGKGEQIRRLL